MREVIVGVDMNGNPVIAFDYKAPHANRGTPARKHYSRAQVWRTKYFWTREHKKVARMSKRRFR